MLKCRFEIKKKAAEAEPAAAVAEYIKPIEDEDLNSKKRMLI